MSKPRYFTFTDEEIKRYNKTYMPELYIQESYYHMFSQLLKHIFQC